MPIIEFFGINGCIVELVPGQDKLPQEYTYAQDYMIDWKVDHKYCGSFRIRLKEKKLFTDVFDVGYRWVVNSKCGLFYYTTWEVSKDSDLCSEALSFFRRISNLGFFDGFINFAKRP